MILPLVSELLGRVGRHPSVEAVFDIVRRRATEAALAGLVAPARALVVALAAVTLGRPVVVLASTNEQAEQFAQPLRWYFTALTGRPGTQVTLLPSRDVLPWEETSLHPEIAEARAVTLWRFSTGQATVLVAPVRAALARLREPEFYRRLARMLARDEAAGLEEVVAQLRGTGYERVELVEMPGQFAIRGGILDVFSPEAARPVRIELFGDTVESLREFDPATQRSVAPLERTTLAPLVESPVPPGEELPEDTPGSLLALAGDAVVALDEPHALEDATRNLRTRIDEAYHQAARSGDARPPNDFFLSEEEWWRALEQHPRLALAELALGEKGLELPTQPTPRFRGNVAAFTGEARGRLERGEQVIVSAASVGELERLADLCHEFELPYRMGEIEPGATSARVAEEASAGSMPAVVLVRAPLEAGVVFTANGLVLVGNADLFETLPAEARARRQRPRTAGFFSDFSDLKSGDFVVHVDHGIGRFEGLRQLSVDGGGGEFLELVYAEDAKLFVPLARLDLVQKYQTLGAARPALDRLGTGAWESRKSRVRRSVSEMAEKLLRLYADRKTVEGHAFAADTPWLGEFEDVFEFEETPDQAQAIEDVKHDMERAVPMDRLLCGDVGYGKTEVAMRAAFKAVGDGFQVAVLAPTTVLAFQHYETFRRRFGAFPVRVEMLSRFRTAGEQKRVVADAATGQVDILIGTHRLLSRDVKFRKLGLLVVDEEQRFGVAHKERLKELAKHVDVLTMSATPIPRTLHMSLVGLRDMSVIETAPKDRLAIQTVVAPFSEALVQRAIEEELERGGQVFFVHNRVESIQSLAHLVKRLVPKARVVVGHGQMDERELERVMLKFIRNDADVLVSTTIVENGLDIPRANTILINRADRFGLAELYQLRGRVGRSERRAYAYLLIPQEASLSPIARQRLAALREFSELGSGFRIAAMDLELRGAGNLLGREQHGHVNAVGFDLYCRMLERAVAERKGEAVAPEKHATLNLGLDIRIPTQYIPSENMRLRTYKRIAGIANDAEAEEVRRELADRFGPPPPTVENLLEYARLKSLAERLLVASVERTGMRVAVKFHPDPPVKADQLVRLLRRRKGLRLDPAGVLWMDWESGSAHLVEAVRNVLLQLEPKA